jgi:hypothetical protein
MATDTLVTLPDIAVMYVAGEAGKPIAEQAPAAFRQLEAPLASLKGRRFYGAVLRGEYRACIALEPGEDAAPLPHPVWTIPGGRYARRRLRDWERHTDMITPGFAALRGRADFDPSRPCLEFYRSQSELLLMAPVR